MLNIISMKVIPIIKLSLLAMLLVFTSGCLLSQEPNDVLDRDEGYEDAVLTAIYDPKPDACMYMIKLCNFGDEYPNDCHPSTPWPVRFDIDENGNCTIYEDFSPYYTDGYDRVYVNVWAYYQWLTIINPVDPPAWWYPWRATWKACDPYCE